MATARPRQQQRRPQQGRAPVPRSLRVGIILGGKIVEERLVRKRTNITVGQSAKNTFSVPIEGLPREWPMFIVHDDRYALQFTDHMDGRISDGNEVYTLSALKGSHAQQRGEAWVIPLAETARGKIVVGEMTLLFQFVAAPPLQPRPHLPASVRGSFADRIDPHLAVVLAISLAVHAGIAIAASNIDKKKDRTDKIYEAVFKPKKVSARFKRVKIKAKADDKGKADAKKDGDKKKTAKKPSKKPSKKPGKKPAKSGGDKNKTKTPERVSDEQIERTVQITVGAGGGLLGPEGDNTRSAARDLDKTIAAVKTSGDRVGKVGAGKGDRVARGGDARRVGAGERAKGPNVGKGVEDTGKKAKPRVPKSRIRLGGRAKGSDAKNLSPQIVTRTIQRRFMNGLRSCHKLVLKTDPNAGGKVTLKFTVGESGRVVSASVNGFNGTVDNCIQKRMLRWRFSPKPKDSDGDPTDATFRISLQLQAS